MKLKRDFYNRSTLIVARELLGKYLCRKMGNKIVRVKITETEAYCGIKDKACHASKGLTPRTKIMFGPSGHAYVYMIYGIYFCLNFVTEEEGNPSAVLIRKASIKYKVSSIKDKRFPNSPLILKLDGPGKLCRELKINKKLNEIDICKSKELWIESVSRQTKEKNPIIKRGKRIGVDYAGKWKDKLWRFYVD
ncbi:MAG: DNA-3-methyladenine glycosylase [bacterium]|nr:DNA-3-methyladenine glycosylase [bacterium]